MVNIFPAIEARFKGDPELVRRCRLVYEGFAGGERGALTPYVEIHFGPSSAEFDTFTTDVEAVDVDVVLYSQGESSRNIYRMIDVFQVRFDDCKLVGADYTSAAFARQPGGSGPTLIDAVYQAELSYQWIGELATLTPAVRFG